MKIAILGSGVAGLAFGIIMKQKGHQVYLYERSTQLPVVGNAFLMHHEGMQILRDLLETEDINIGTTIKKFTLRRPDETIVQEASIDSWQCMKRRDLINILAKKFGEDSIYFGKTFSHFEWNKDLAQQAVFEDGSVVEADMFVGSDGCHSNVRKALFGPTAFTSVDVQEILGVIKDPNLVELFKGSFTKYQDVERGLSFGFIPTSANEIIWYHQFDVRLTGGMLRAEDALKENTLQSLQQFPELVHQLIQSTQEKDMYLWNTKDFDALSSFHRGNVVLIGDAAHVALPFTSAGTTNALYDARELAHALENNQNMRLAFNQYYLNRIDMIREHVELGRTLKQNFLNPENTEATEIPLVRFNTNHQTNTEEQKSKVEVLYFTDPICSTCWTFQSGLRSFRDRYAEKMDFKYVMGGLLPSWNGFNRGGIRKPEDVYHHWKEVSEQSGIPIDPTIWLTDPVRSSFPSSIAYIAAAIQDEEKSKKYLERLQELVFLERTNIGNVEVLHRLAISFGLDGEQFLDDMKGRGIGSFLKDLSLVRKYGVNMLPTLLFKKNDDILIRINGPQPFEVLERALLDIDSWTVEDGQVLNEWDRFNESARVLPDMVQCFRVAG
jgi:2-polyprenyl-6-methoxyphenol hydroxylase-like FAD-dependent oxidoreductase/predicted DsbA family dithiol-disulfide isomerase